MGEGLRNDDTGGGNGTGGTIGPGKPGNGTETLDGDGTGAGITGTRDDKAEIIPDNKLLAELEAAAGTVSNEEGGGGAGGGVDTRIDEGATGGDTLGGDDVKSFLTYLRMFFFTLVPGVVGAGDDGDDEDDDDDDDDDDDNVESDDGDDADGDEVAGGAENRSWT